MRLSETERMCVERARTREDLSREVCEEPRRERARRAAHALGGSLHRERFWRHGWKARAKQQQSSRCAGLAHAETCFASASKRASHQRRRFQSGSAEPDDKFCEHLCEPTSRRRADDPGARPDRTFACGSGAMQVRHDSTITCLHPRTLPPGLLWRRNRTERRFNKLSRAMFAAATPAVRRERACGRRRRRRR